MTVLMDTQASERPRIEALKNGPLKVSGLSHLFDADGSELQTRETILLCPCGHSSRKPYCDGSHARVVGYRSHKLEGRLPDKVHDYHGKHITIHDNRGVCSHAEYFVRDLPSVFNLETCPWIHPTGATADEIARTIEKCPSGALSYTRDGVLHKDIPRDPAIRVDRCGPYEVTGGPELVDSEGSVPESKEHYTLCRCGASGNKPFCDGAHWNTVGQDEGVQDCRPYHPQAGTHPGAKQSGYGHEATSH